MPKPVVEIAIFEVEIDGAWVEYARVPRRADQKWEWLRLADIKPKIQMRYLDVGVDSERS